MPKSKHHFAGWATKNNLKCTDGRTILKDAFKENDGSTVPLVWQHMHDEPSNVLGHALLENREDGVYAYCSFNDSPSGKNARLLVEHRDIDSLSIYANSLVEKSRAVVHGVIRELSLVLSGSNPGAKIEYISMQHADGSITEMDDEAIIYTGIPLEFEKSNEPEDLITTPTSSELSHADGDGETVGDVFETLSEKQKIAVYAIISNIIDNGVEEGGSAQQSAIIDDEGDEGIMKTNVFDGSAVAHARPKLTREQFQEILRDAQKLGSFKESFLAHAGTYGIDNIDYLFPDAQALTNEPELISRKMEWVTRVLQGARKSRFSRIKSLHADITVETARALGYVTGNLKKEEVFALLRRITGPTTIYKKQKLDRDDIIDITDLDVVAWLKAEMRIMLDEELARAALVSDGRDPVLEEEDKIDETCIRPIWTDDDMYSHKVQLTADLTTEEIMDEIVKARTNYRGSGNPTMFITSDFLTDMLLLKDTTGRRIYETEASLAAALRVSGFVEVPVMDGLSRLVAATTYNLLGIIVNMRDYVFGADKGGEVNFFDDFDIDYNQFKYLLETRCSGTLTQAKSALVIEQAAAG